jgi:hypothetical protein
MLRCDQNGPPAKRSEPDWHQEGAYLKAIRNRRATQPPAPFSSQPSGPRPVGCFSALLAPYVSSQDTLVAPALKNSQLTGGETYTYFGDRTLVCFFLEGLLAMPGSCQQSPAVPGIRGESFSTQMGPATGMRPAKNLQALLDEAKENRDRLSA